MSNKKEKNYIYVNDFNIFEDNGYTGYYIDTTGGTLILKISTDQKCCEKIELNSYGFTDIVGCAIRDWEFGCDVLYSEIPKEARKEWNVNNENREQFVIRIFIKDKNGDDKELFLALANVHNGYYAHDMKLIFGDSILVDSWL